MWIPITLLLLVGVISVYLHMKENTEDLQVLRHTIAVNLSILISDLEELGKIAASAENSSAAADANLLLQNSASLARSAEDQLDSASRRELENRLGQVFHAMNLSSRARRVLNACSDSSLLG